MNLLIDIGNSRLKWALHEATNLTEGEAVNYDSDFTKQLFCRWQNVSQPGCIAIANVNASEKLNQVQGIAYQLWPGIKIFRPQSLAEGYGVRNGYRDPEKLGIDRWLALVAARNYFPFSVCIVDCGTAVTVDFLNQDGIHLGGLITPGLKLMKKSLAQGAADLELISQDYPAGLANNTEAAIYSGALFSIAGLIEHVMLKTPGFQLILTGGDAEIIARQLTIDVMVKSDLVLSGLALVSSHSSKEP